MTSAHTVVLVRHAKAEQHNPDDHSRRLTERGTRDARALGQVLTAESLGSGVALVSSATRTTQTWDGIAGSVSGFTVEILDDLYHADTEEVLQLLAGLEESVATAVVVGHNPTIASLAWDLHDGSESDAFAELKSGGYSPSVTTVFDLPGPWSSIATRQGLLRTFIDPR